MTLIAETSVNQMQDVLTYIRGLCPRSIRSLAAMRELSPETALTQLKAMGYLVTDALVDIGALEKKIVCPVSLKSELNITPFFFELAHAAHGNAT